MLPSAGPDVFPRGRRPRAFPGVAIGSYRGQRGLGRSQSPSVGGVAGRLRRVPPSPAVAAFQRLAEPAPSASAAAGPQPARKPALSPLVSLPTTSNVRRSPGPGDVQVTVLVQADNLPHRLPPAHPALASGWAPGPPAPRTRAGAGAYRCGVVRSAACPVTISPPAPEGVHRADQGTDVARAWSAGRDTTVRAARRQPAQVSGCPDHATSSGAASVPCRRAGEQLGGQRDPGRRDPSSRPAASGTGGSVRGRTAGPGPASRARPRG